jgi:DNA invertase Pin-like site-specific DNA recombinase
MNSTSERPAKVPASVSGRVVLGGRSSRGDWPFSTTKIQPGHQERLAIVYVRQSSPQQVLEHRESAELQYSLAQQAVALGWPEERVLVIDEDQGQSARSAEARLGFQQLLAEVSLDHVGLVLGIEMSRLARSCKDWYQLLEVCALFRTLLFDQDGLYDPTNYNALFRVLGGFG